MIDLEAIFSRYKPYLDANRMTIYAAQPYEDLLLLKWWMQLQETGEMERLIVPDSRSLKRFFNIFAAPTVLIYSTTQENEMAQCAWFTPADQNSKHHVAYSGLWCSPSARGTFAQLNFAALTYMLAFEFYHAIVGTTWQPELLDEHKKLGYNIVGCIPNLYDQPLCYIVHLTREDFFTSRLYNTYQRTLERR